MSATFIQCQLGNRSNPFPLVFKSVNSQARTSNVNTLVFVKVWLASEQLAQAGISTILHLKMGKNNKTTLECSYFYENPLPDEVKLLVEA